MDDHQFDDIIKRKVGEYEEPGFDPTALAALHHQMAAAKMVWPWYSRYRTELMFGSCILLSTMLIIWSQRVMNAESQKMLEGRIRILEAQQLDAPKEEKNSLNFLRPDTIRIIEIREQNPLLYTSLIAKIAQLESAVKEMTEHLGSNGRLAPEITTRYPTTEKTYETAWSHRSLHRRVVPRRKDQESPRVQPLKDTLADHDNGVKLSAATIREIERHYSDGIGIKVGPSLEFSHGVYQMGSGKIDLTTGIIGDFIFSPSFSVETGLKYMHRFYDITDPNSLSQKTFPYRDNSLGSLKQADIDSWIFEVPLNLKYRRPTSMKSHWYVGAGYSSLMYSQQVVEYEYDFDNSSAAAISTAHRQQSLRSYPGLLNISLGISRELKNRKILETSFYYQHGLGDRGIEKINGGFLGARGVYWFTIR